MEAARLVAVGLVKRANVRKAFAEAPCFVCGYNGQGYFNSDTHSCAAMYHSGDWSPLIATLSEPS